MKFVVVVVILCTIHSSYSQLLCDEQSGKRRMEDCYKNNDMGVLLGGYGTLEIKDICSKGQLSPFSACMSNVTKSCFPDFFDWQRMSDSVKRICRSQDYCPKAEGDDCNRYCEDDSNCGNEQMCCSNGCGKKCMSPEYWSENCDSKDSGLAMCITQMQRSWEEIKKTNTVGEDQIWCHLAGGIKKCITDFMMDSCKSKWKYHDLVDTFSAKSCHGYYECGVCDTSVSDSATLATSSATISLVCIAIVSFLRNLL